MWAREKYVPQFAHNYVTFKNVIVMFPIINWWSFPRFNSLNLSWWFSRLNHQGQVTYFWLSVTIYSVKLHLCEYSFVNCIFNGSEFWSIVRVPTSGDKQCQVICKRVFKIYFISSYTYHLLCHGPPILFVLIVWLWTKYGILLALCNIPLLHEIM